MGIEKKTTRIGDHTYTLETFGAKQGMSVLMALLRFVGPSFARAATEGTDNVEKALSGALESFALTAKEEDFNFVSDAFAKRCKVEIQTTTKGGPGVAQIPLADVFDSHFAGGAGLRNMIQWLIWCAKENFGDFLAVSGTDLLSGIQNQVRGSAESPSPTG